MNWKSGGSSGASKPSGWNRKGRGRERPLHRWQDSSSVEVGRARRRLERSRWAVVSVLALGLLVLLTYLLLTWRQKTPLVLVVAAEEYASSAPIPPNSWAREDANTLKHLDGKNVLVASPKQQPWNIQPLRFIPGPKELNLSPSRNPFWKTDQPFILYLNMHGIVNEKGEPCLLLPDASLANNRRWYRLKDVLEEIRSRAQDRNTLLILDCNRIRVNWNLGILYNSFVERVQQVVEEADLSNLAVLTSAGPGQINWSSADLQGSAFGKYLSLGLAGDADGNRDGKVSLYELRDYLQHKVDAWSRFNRGERQTPTLFPAKVADFRVTWSDRGALTQLVEELRTRQEKPPAPHLAPDELAVLWNRLEDVRTPELIRIDPLRCRELEHKLLRLEELSHGGTAYSEAARNLRDELEKLLNEADTPRPASLVTLEVAHSLPACEYFGVHNTEQLRQVASQLERLATIPDTKSLLEEIGKDAIAPKLAETQLVLALREQNVSALWRQPVDVAKALQRRITGERLAFPLHAGGGAADERANYHIRAVASEADQKRRQAEDILFVGEMNAPQPYDQLAKEADELYTRTQQQWEQATAAFALHDQVLAQMPYLAAWLCSPLAEKVPERDRLVNDHLLPLIQATHEFSEQLNQASPMQTRDAPLPFLQTQDRVRRHLAALKGAFKSEADRLRAQVAAGSEGPRAIEAVLLVPLLPSDETNNTSADASLGEVRRQLWANYSRICTELSNQFNERTEGSEKKEDLRAGEEIPPSYQHNISGWQSHPLLEILEMKGATTEGQTEAERLRWCEESAAKARGRLSQIGRITSAGGGALSQTDEVWLERLPLSRAERAVREAAAIYFDPHQTAPVLAELRSFDLRQLLLWHAERALDDFWGSGQQPLFAEAASNYLAAAERISATPSFAVAQQLEGLRNRLNERRKAKTSGLRIQARTALKNVSTGDVDVSLQVRTETGLAQFPRGAAAVYLQNTSGRLTQLKAESATDSGGCFVLSPELTTQELRFHVPADLADEGNLTAVAFFRGRNDSLEFPLPQLKGVRIAYRPHHYDSQQITLFGDRQQRSQYIFILDCSASMNERVGGATENVVRMDVAKRQFMSMLQELAARNQDRNIQVGVWFFGHRAGTKDQGIVYNRAWPGIPEGLRPSQDVERILPLQPFGREELGFVRDKVSAVKQWGITPLYLAVLQALQDFEEPLPGVARSIIAITDGQNNQDEPLLPNLRAAPPTSLDQLIAAWRQRQRQGISVPIHVLGFDLPKQEAAQAGAEYTRLAEVTGGSYAEVQSGNDLLQALRERLELDGYMVFDAQQQPIVPQPSPLNEPVEILGKRFPQTFSVVFRSITKQVSLEGGEAIKLYVHEGDPPDIEAKPYIPPYGRSLANSGINLLAGDKATDLVLRVHRPIFDREHSSVRFPISLQRDPNGPGKPHFTPRPAETWVEITPLQGTAETGAPYVFYDTNFEPHEPVPVLEWVASQWPEEADRARVRFWCKYEPRTPITQFIALRDVVNSPAGFGDYQPVTGIRGVGLKIKINDSEDGDYRIVVEEKHEPSTPIDVIRVQLVTAADAKPKQVIHQFDAQSGYATHTYDFDPKLRTQLEQTGRIAIVPAEIVKDGALQLPKDRELVVPIERGGSYLVPTATGSR